MILAHRNSKMLLASNPQTALAIVQMFFHKPEEQCETHFVGFTISSNSHGGEDTAEPRSLRDAPQRRRMSQGEY